MVLDSTDEDSVLLVAEELSMVQQDDMNLFYITEHRLVNMSYPQKGVKMELKMRRKIMSEMMTTYLPSVLLMMITYATTFFKPFFFEAALSVNLTTMLVMTTIFISKMEGLPPTSDIKMIDIWLVLCQMVPFAEVILLTAMEYHRKDQDDKYVVITEVFPKVTVATQTNDKEEMDIPIESQWRKKICQKSWFPSLKTLGFLTFLQIICSMLSLTKLFQM